MEADVACPLMAPWHTVSYCITVSGACTFTHLLFAQVREVADMRGNCDDFLFFISLNRAYSVPQWFRFTLDKTRQERQCHRRFLSSHLIYSTASLYPADAVIVK